MLFFVRAACGTPFRDDNRCLDGSLVLGTNPACVSQEWRATLWKDIRTDIMEDGTKSFTKEVKALPKGIKDESVFKVGLLGELQSSASL